MPESPALSSRVDVLEKGLEVLSDNVSKLTDTIGTQVTSSQTRLAQLETQMTNLFGRIDTMAECMQKQGETFRVGMEQLGRDMLETMDKHVNDNRQRDSDVYNRLSNVGRTDWRMVAQWAVVAVALLGGGLGYVKIATEPLHLGINYCQKQVDAQSQVIAALAADISHCSGQIHETKGKLDLLERMDAMYDRIWEAKLDRAAPIASPSP